MKAQHPPTIKPLVVHQRWMIRRDMAEVLAIEEATAEFPWSEEDFIRCLRQRNCIGRVAEHGERVIAFNIYELHKNRLHLMNVAVHPSMQRRRVGTAVMDNLKGKLSRDRRNRIVLEVRESNLGGCMFLKANGFRAISIMRGYYDEQLAPEDALLFQYRYGQ